MLVGIVVDNRGLVPDADVNRLIEFGNEIKKDFEKSLGSTAGQGSLFTIKLSSPEKVNYVVIEEDISKGERVREYNLYGMKDGKWETLSNGSCIGHKRVESVHGGVYSGIKLEITKSEGKPDIREMECF